MLGGWFCLRGWPAFMFLILLEFVEWLCAEVVGFYVWFVLEICCILLEKFVCLCWKLCVVFPLKIVVFVLEIVCCVSAENWCFCAGNCGCVSAGNCCVCAGKFVVFRWKICVFWLGFVEGFYTKFDGFNMCALLEIGNECYNVCDVRCCRIVAEGIWM